MSQEGISRQYDRGIAKDYGEKSLELAEKDPGRNFLKNNLDTFPRSAAVVDVGCGNGIDLKSYKAIGFTHLVGVEPSEKLREEARILAGEEVKILDGTFEKLPLADASVDAIVSRFAMHYANDIEAALAEVARVLKQGGMFAAVISHPDADAKVAQNPDGTITITLFGGKVPITFPAHTQEEYFGDTFKKLFDLKSAEGYTGKEQDRGVTDPTQPNALCFVAVRK